jgi:hypothetical protein
MVFNGVVSLMQIGSFATDILSRDEHDDELHNFTQHLVDNTEL